MRFYRAIILLLLTMFLVNTVSASTGLHLPVQADAHVSVHQHHAMHGDMQAAQDTQQAAPNCKNCHDCLSCFSILPLTVTHLMPALPDDQVSYISSPDYYPPALAQLQRPPIPLSM